VSPSGLARLLDLADDQTWGETLRKALPTGGQGTLEDRLRGVAVRAKTGTLMNVSALSGWVWAKRRDRWFAFSILSRGMSKSTAVDIEDRIVRILNQRAR
jgi:serine-type D-Ala-D-Ala carboxypeptidase/endopeptidase (penicillin-binding protein 4)